MCLSWECLSSNESFCGTTRQRHSQYVPLGALEKNGKGPGKEWGKGIEWASHLKVHHPMLNRKDN